MKKKEMLTSHELGFYKDFAIHDDETKVKKVKEVKSVVANRDYLYLYLVKMAVRGKVSMTQKELAQKLGVTEQTIRRGQHRLEKCGLLEKVKEANPVTRQPTTFKVIK
jgi:predicted transcriptional regulator